MKFKKVKKKTEVEEKIKKKKSENPKGNKGVIGNENKNYGKFLGRNG